MLLWFADLMNVTEEVTIHRPNVSTLLSSAFIRGDLNAATRGPFIRSLMWGVNTRDMLKDQSHCGIQSTKSLEEIPSLLFQFARLFTLKK